MVHALSFIQFSSFSTFINAFIVFFAFPEHPQYFCQTRKKSEHRNHSSDSHNTWISFWGAGQIAEQLRVLEQKLFVDGSIPSIRFYCAVQFCSATGARRKELVRVRKQDLILNDTEPYVTLTKLKGRGNAAWLWPAPQKLIHVL